MEIRSFNAELAIANLCFKRVFSNIIIHRFKSTGEPVDIPIPCQFDQRSRIVKNWENSEKRAAVILPQIVISRTGWNRADDRYNNQHNEVKYEISSKNRIYDLLTPLPIDINYELTVFAKTPSDIDQIASNFMIVFADDIYVKSIHPKYEGICINSQIVMDGSVSEEHHNELDNGSDDMMTATFNFTYKTYLFGGNQQAKKISPTIISTQTFTAISDVETEITYSDIDGFQKKNPESGASAIVYLQPDEIDDFQNKYPFASITAVTPQEITTTISAEVENPDISSIVYDDFVPIIKTLDVGFYPTPWASAHNEYFDFVDNTVPADSRKYYRDRIFWKIDETSPDFPNNVKPINLDYT